MTVEEAQAKAKELGHCICHTQISCPCLAYINHNICACSMNGGEEE